MRRLAIAILAAGALWAAVPATAGAVTTASPLPGSSFQGGDGDQANPGADVSSPADGIVDVDWEAVASQVATSDDPSPDNEFQNGSHEQAPHGWDLGTAPTGQVNPSKANILAAWSLNDPTSTDTFLYLAFKREASTGNTFLSFELNTRTDTWVNDIGDTIPCRTTGDVIVSYEVPSANSTDVNITVYRWTSTTVDAGTGCARTGTFTAATPPTTQAQGTLNPASVTNFLSPGVYGASFSGGTFGEAALNLSAILGGLGDACFNFGQIGMHSRSSESIDSALQDFVSPVPLFVRSCSVSGTKFNDLDADGTFDATEPGLAGWTFYVDYDDDGVRDGNEPFGVSDANGDYTIGDVNPGTFKVREELQSGWSCTFPSPDCFHTVTFTNGNATGRDFGNTRQSSVTIIKDSVPDDVEDVSFTTTGAGLSNFQLDDDGDETNTLKRDRAFTALTAFGAKTVTETVPGGFDLTGISCTGDADVQIGGDGDFDAGDTGVTIDLDSGEDVVCTFTNTKRGTVEIEKQTDPAHPTDSFAFSAPSFPGTGDDSFNLTDNGVKSVSVSPGSYLVTESDPTPAYDLTGLTCNDGGSATPSTTSVPDRQATVNVDPGETVRCTYTNSRRGTIEVEKQTNPANPTDSFGFSATDFPGTADDTFSLNDDGVKSVVVAPGAYQVTENDPTPAYDLTSISCDDGTSGTPSTTSLPSRLATINVAPGETVRCVFTNTKRGQLEIEKQTNPANPTDSFGFSAPSLPGTGDDTFNLSDDGVKTVAVAPGAYTVTEDDPTPAYDLTALTCDDGTSTTPSTTSVASRQATVQVDAGETVRCVFTNTKRGTVEIEKQTDPANPTDSFGFAAASFPGTGDDTFSLSDDGVKSVQVVPGTYTVTENDPTPAYDLTALTCDDGQSTTPSTTSVPNRQATVQVDPGETVRCVFTNTKRGQLEIEKQTDPAHPTDSFGFSAPSLPGTGDDTFNLNDDGVKTVAVAPGAYTVTENDPTPAYDLTALTCDDGTSATASTTSVPNRQATVNVEPGETVRCVFTNTKRGQLEIEKQTDPANPTDSFGFSAPSLPGTADDTFTLGDDGVKTVGNLVPGAYDVTEDDPAPPYALTSIACSDGQSTSPSAGDVPTRTATVNVDPGETVRCVFTNTRSTGRLEVVKNLEPATDGGRFDLQINGVTEKADAGDGDTTGEKPLATGDHTVGETAAAGTDLADYDSSIECRGDNGQGAVVASSQDTGPLTVAVTPNSDIVCVITNTRLTGSIAGVKFEDTDRDGLAREAGEPGLGGWTIYVDLDDDGVRDPAEPSTTTAADGTWLIDGLVSGDYVVREELQQGFDCMFPDPCRHALTLAPGENRTGVDFGNAPQPQAPPPATPPEPAPPAAPPAAAPAQEPPPPQVSPEVVPAGFARLIGPSGCVGRSFLARVRGESIARVVFFLDGRRIRTVRRPDRKGRWGVRINPNRLRAGGHRLRARVTFVQGSGTRSRTFNLRFQRCTRAALPEFTG